MKIRKTQAGLASLPAPPQPEALPEITSLILNTAVAVPPHAHSQEDISAALGTWLAGREDLAARARTIAANAGVRRRYTVRPLDWYPAHTSVTGRSRVYQEEAITLGESAARAALMGASVEPERIGLVISASCTGVMIPSLDSYLIGRLGLGPHTRRLPLTELGCVAGAAALSQADLFLRAYPDSAVLIVTAELASLTAQVADFSLANIVSAALFGDGAAAAVVAGPGLRRAGPPNRHRPAGIIATRSAWFPKTPELMGFENTDGGLKIVLSPRVPRFVREHLPRALAPFLEEHGLRRADLSHFLLHPGGRKVLEGLERALQLSPQDTRYSWQVLSGYGNLSSATVLFMLYHFEREASPRSGDLGLLAAVGPGFCAEFLLLRW
jgi:alkylresorcinol/alkylpyrone synthase